MALLDEGETDWKVIVVDVQDPLAGKLNDIEDVERHLPGLIRATNEWFRYVTRAPRVLNSNKRTGSTRFPTGSPRTPLRSLARPRTRDTLLRLFTSVTKHGVASSLASLPPRPPPMIFPCAYHLRKLELCAEFLRSLVAISLFRTLPVSSDGTIPPILPFRLIPGRLPLPSILPVCICSTRLFLV